MIKILLLFVTLFFSFNLRVDAALCDKEHITKLKELAEQIEVSYEYIDYSKDILNNSGSYLTNTYNLTINLLSSDLYLIYDNRKYFYDSSNGGMFTFLVNSGNVDFAIHTKNCADYRLRNVRLELPKFNTYFYRKECQDLVEYDIDYCDPWYQGVITDSSFKKVVDEYLNVDNDKNDGYWNLNFNFFKEGYIYIIAGVGIVLIIIVIILIYRKRSVLE